MKKIRAFVGHSFTAEDSELVSTVISYLDGIKELNDEFTWDHAKHPEATTVDAKVLELITDRNLFIGICTRKERVAASASFSPCWLNRRKMKVMEAQLEWKTSDWIIQEIGLAIGRGMKIILLLEEGVKYPGALQGNLEYIPLSRQSPEKSFEKLLGMIAALCRGAADAVPATHETARAAEAGIDETEGIEQGRWGEPRGDWKYEDYKRALVDCVALGNKDAEKRLNEQFLLSEIANAEENRKGWAARTEYLRLAFDSGGALATLERMHAESPQNSEILVFLARGYLQYEEHGKAANAYEHAAQTAITSKGQIECLGNAALNYQKAGNLIRTYELAALMRQRGAEAGEGEVEILNAERALSEEQKNDESELAVRERLLEINPADDNTRFAVAFKYSELNRHELAAYHYSRIPGSTRSAAAWNNLGVCFAAMGLPIRSVAAYRHSEKSGETLAMSNLAGKLLESGFADQAEELLNEAMKIPHHHSNVDRALGTVKDAVEAEIKKEAALLETAKPFSEYYRQLGQCIAKPNILNLAGAWHAPECVLEFSLTGGNVVARGTYEVPKKGLGLLGSLALGLLKAPESKATTTYLIEYRGVVRGRTIAGTLSRRPGDDQPRIAPSVLSGAEAAPTFLMWIDDGGMKINVMERGGTSEPKFSIFSKASVLASAINPLLALYSDEVQPVSAA